MKPTYHKILMLAVALVAAPGLALAQDDDHFDPFDDLTNPWTNVGFNVSGINDGRNGADFIEFADDGTKAACVALWDANGDGELSYDEAAAVTDIERKFFRNTTIGSFDELQYFTGLTEIGVRAFMQSSVTSVVIPPNVETIGIEAFYYSQLQSVVFSENGNLRKIDSKAFLYAENMGNNTFGVNLPDGLEEIGDDAFEASKIRCIGLPSSIKKVGKAAFYTQNLNTVIMEMTDEVEFGEKLLWNAKATVTYVPSDRMAYYKSLYEADPTTYDWVPYLKPINGNVHPDPDLNKDTKVDDEDLTLMDNEVIDRKTAGSYGKTTAAYALNSTAAKNGRVTIRRGSTATLSLDFTGGDITQYAGAQWTFEMPFGLSFALDADDKLDAKVEQSTTHEIRGGSPKSWDDAYYTLMAYDPANGTNFAAQQAPFVSFTLYADEGMEPGEYAIALSDLLLVGGTKGDRTTSMVDDLMVTIIITDGLLGDVNHDGQVTIADVTALANIILGKDATYNPDADVNGDGNVTIADMTALVNIILGK